MASVANCSQVQVNAIWDVDEVIHGQSCWVDQVNRVLLRRAAPAVAAAPVAVDSCCGFGAWYEDLDRLKMAPWSAPLEQARATHARMHALAADLLGRPAARAPAPEAYDAFVAICQDFKAVLRNLHGQLIKDVCLVDYLTGVWNRAALAQRIGEEYERALRHRESCCLCMMDLDHFKTINDRHGHATGDHVLQVLVRVVAKRLRRYDSLFRYGGEEFLMCLPGVAAPEAATAMDRIRADIAAAPVVLADGTSIGVTASFGVAELATALSIEQNIEIADRALFRAKAAGRNRVCR